MTWTTINPTAVAELSYIKKANQILKRDDEIFVKTGSQTLLVWLLSDWSWGQGLQGDVYDLDARVFTNPDMHPTLLIEHTWPGKLARFLGADLWAIHSLEKDYNNITGELKGYSNIKIVQEYTDSPKEFPNIECFNWTQQQYKEWESKLHGIHANEYSPDKSELQGKIGHFIWAAYIAKKMNWKVL